MPMAWTGTVAPSLREARQRNELRQSLDRLLCSESITQAARSLRLGEHKTAIVGAVDHRIADAIPSLHPLPVSEQPAGGLRVALDHMPRQGGTGQPVPVVPRPAKFVHERAHHHGAVDTAAGDDDIGPQSSARAMPCAPT